MSFTEITHHSFGSRLGGAMFGLVLGPLLFLASFVVLFWNEGREDQSVMARRASEVSSTAPDSAHNGRFVSATGRISTDDRIGDQRFLLPGNYLALQRKVEMFAWTEESRSVTTRESGGSETKRTEYTYTSKWVSGTPPSSSSFRDREGHQNPPKSVPDEQFKASSGKVGELRLEMSSLSLPDLEPLRLDRDVVDSDAGGMLVGNQYVYRGQGSYDEPVVGDVRIRYQAITPGTTVTVFGMLRDGAIVPWVDNRGNQFYRGFLGGREAAIGKLHQEYTTMLWVFRVVGFLLMWIGLLLVMGPVNLLLDFVPVLGTIAGGLWAGLTFALSVLLTLVTVALANLLYNPIVAALVSLIVLGIVFGVVARSRAPRRAFAT
jgi:hypothetical protein